MPRTTNARNTTPPITLPAITPALDVEDVAATAVEDSAGVVVEDDASAVGARVEMEDSADALEDAVCNAEGVAVLETVSTMVLVSPALVELPGGHPSGGHMGRLW